MNPDEIQAAIAAAVKVTPALVLQAKAYLVRHAPGRTDDLIAAFAAEMGPTIPRQVVVHPSVDSAESITNVARWLASQTAAREAVWALIGAGALVPRSAGLESLEFSVAWTTVIPGSGGTSSGWHFGRSIPVPSEVALPSSGATHLTDGDLYLGSLGLPDLDQTIAESLRSAVACFRVDLFLPAQVMLSRAAEGAWTRLGEALVAVATSERAAIKLGRDLDGGLHFAQLPDRIVTLYTLPAYAAVITASGVKHADLRGAQVWTDALREARNAVHNGTQAPLPATWETTAALLMGAVPNLRLLWTARGAAHAMSAGVDPTTT